MTILYEALRTVILHFTMSVKNKEKLQSCMAILEMKPLSQISWCATRMGHFLAACTMFSNSLVPAYDTMSSLNIRPEERDVIFTDMMIFVLKVLAALEPDFMKGRFFWFLMVWEGDSCSTLCLVWVCLDFIPMILILKEMILMNFTLDSLNKYFKTKEDMFFIAFVSLPLYHPLI